MITEDQLRAAWEDAGLAMTAREEIAPPGWLTAEGWAEITRYSPDHARRKLTKAVAKGLAEAKEYRTHRGHKVKYYKFNSV